MLLHPGGGARYLAPPPDREVGILQDKTEEGWPDHHPKGPNTKRMTCLVRTTDLSYNKRSSGKPDCSTNTKRNPKKVCIIVLGLFA